MIFALLIILVFAGIMAYAQFGVPFNTASPKAQVMAENMAVWHQAAMLESVQNPLPVPAPNPPIACAAGTGCAMALNSYIWNGAAQGQLAGTWPNNTYIPMVPEGFQSGWQSFFLGNVNSQGGYATGPGVCTIVGSPCAESYVLTVFRGYGGTVCTGNNCQPGTESGGTDPSNFTQGLADTVTERAGLGTINCTGTLCQFSRITAVTNPGAATVSIDNPLVFDAALLDRDAAAYFGAVGVTAENILQNRTAIMTRVN